jgi:hypothetical protein
MHSKQRGAYGAATAWFGMRSPDVGVFLDELSGNLDITTLRATLKLMTCEIHEAMHRQQRLIALERLDGRDTARSLDQLGELKTLQGQLLVVFAAHADTEDYIEAQEMTAQPLPLDTGTASMRLRADAQRAERSEASRDQPQA